jgi:hypothetical protein
VKEGFLGMKTSPRAIRLKGLEKECGVTDISITNALIIDSKGYKPVLICHEADDEYAEYHTKVYYKKQNSNQLYYFLYSGFSSGYFGEGSRGFIDFLELAGLELEKEVATDVVTKKLEAYKRYVFMLDRTFNQLLHVFISATNIKHLAGGRIIKLRDTRPIIIKSWDESSVKLL